MMQEILKPLLDSDVLSDEIKEVIETSLTEAIAAKEDAVRAEVEEAAKANFEAAKAKFEESYKTLEESYKTKLEESKVVVDEAKVQIEELESKIEELETKPFVNVSESDMADAENTLVSELEDKYEAAFDLAKDKFNNAFDVITESTNSIIEELETQLEVSNETVATLEDRITELTEALSVAEANNDVASAVAETEERMRAESEAKIETMKENLVTATEIFLEQEVAEVKADYTAIMKESQGRELLESIKGLVKQYWDVDSEVAEEILEMKKEAETKVEQYKDMLKKEHSRLEESQKEVENLKKKVIVESKSSVLTTDKKVALEKLAENIEADKLESKIDELMESVIDTFNSGFSKKEITQTVEKEVAGTNTVLTESVKTTISSGDSEDKTSEELAKLLDFAGIRK